MGILEEIKLTPVEIAEVRKEWMKSKHKFDPDTFPRMIANRQIKKMAGILYSSQDKANWEEFLKEVESL